MASLQGRRAWLNAVLLLLVTSLGALAWWWNTQGSVQTVERILALDLASIQTIDIERKPTEPGTDLIRLQKQGEDWQLLAPQILLANPVRVRQIFTLLEEKVESSYPAAGKDLAAYGLQPGKVLLRFNGESVVLGDNNPVSQHRYVLHAGNIKLVSEAVFGTLTGNWTELVSLKLAPTGVQSVSLPEKYTSGVEALSTWQAAEAIRIEPVDTTSPAQEQPVDTITLTDNNGKVRELQGWQREDEWVLMDKGLGLQYVLPLSQKDRLLPLKM